MPSLKDLRVRIGSVKSTQKITSAMKMVAAAKLRKAQAQAENARPYADRLESALATLATSVRGSDSASPLLTGNGRDDVQLLVIVSADRGLCGNFNGSIVRAARHQIRLWQGQGKQVKLVFVGRKARDVMHREYGNLILKTFRDLARPRLGYDAAQQVSDYLREQFEEGAFDQCTVLYNRFKSAIAQVPTFQQVIPLLVAAETGNVSNVSESGALYLYEPSEEAIVNALLPRNLSIQVYKALLESAASEHGARMTAMDNATRNAGDMIRRLTLTYNRNRQAAITRELIEIISGAEAL